MELLPSVCNYVSPTQLVRNYKIQEIGEANKQLTPSIKACWDNHHLSRSPFVAGDVSQKWGFKNRILVIVFLIVLLNNVNPGAPNENIVQSH